MISDSVIIDGGKFTLTSEVINTSQKSSFWFNYELEERNALSHFIPNLPLVEFGGGIGVVSCIANPKLKDPNQHVVIEANPTLIQLIEKNRNQNGCQFQIVNRALAYQEKEIRFYLHRRFESSNAITSLDRSILVPATSLHDINNKYNYPICNLICDIEGLELYLIKYELHILKSRVQMFIVEIHAHLFEQQATQWLFHQLHNAGFICIDQGISVYVFKNTALI